MNTRPNRIVLTPKHIMKSPMQPWTRCLPLFLTLLCLLPVGCSSTGKAADSKAEEKGAADAGKGEAGADKDKEADAAPTVSVASAEVGPIEKTLPVTGTLAAPRESIAALSPPVSGVLDALPVHLGETVQKGQVVAHLSAQALLGQIAQARATIGQYTVQIQQAEAAALQQQGQTKSGVLQAQAAVSTAQATLAGTRATLAGAKATQTGNEATLANAQQNLTRLKSLLDEGLVAKKDVEAAELAVHAAEAQIATQKETVSAQEQAVAAQEQTVAGLKEAESAARLSHFQNTVKQKDIDIARQQLQNARGTLQTAEAQMALLTIRAPLTGTVTNVGASIGEAVDTGNKILTIANLDTLLLNIAVPTASASQVRIGQPVVFTVDALPGQRFRATIRLVGTQVDPATSTITATADIRNPKNLLKSDMAARVGLVVGRHDKAILVPRAAVLYDAADSGGGAHVLKPDKDNAVHSAPVTVGYMSDTFAEILSGVQPGERVVTTGGYGLPDGTKVQIEGEKSDEKDDKEKPAGEKPEAGAKGKES